MTYSVCHYSCTIIRQSLILFNVDLFSYLSSPPKVWFQNRRSRWRKREIKNKPTPVTSPAQLQASHRSEPWVPGQFPPYCCPPGFMPTSGATRVPNYDNVWSTNSSSYYFPPEFSATNTTHSSAFTGPSFSFIYPPISTPTLSQITTEEAPWSDQSSQRSSPLFYESDSTESGHSNAHQRVYGCRRNSHCHI